MQLLHGGDDQALNLHTRLALGEGGGVHGPVLDPLAVGGADELLVAAGRLAPAGPGDADPAVALVGSDKDDLPLARREQVANDEVVLVPVQRVLGLVHQDGRVRLELERDDHALGRPAVDQVLEELGHGVEVDDEPLAARHAGRRVKVVKGLLVLDRRRLVLLVGQGVGGVGALDLVLGHAVLGHEEIRHGRGQVQQAVGAEGVHELGYRPQLVQVVGDGDKGQHEQPAVLLGRVVLSQHPEHLVLVLRVGDDAAVVALGHEVQKAVGGVAVVPTVRKQRELPVHEDDGIAGLEKVLGRGGTSGTGAEVVNKPDRLLL